MTVAIEPVIRTMSLEDLEEAVTWAAEEGWNPGLHDARCYYQTDPEGFFVLELNGKPIAAISAISYGREYGFIGFYIVKPEFRGRGFGLRLWRRAMEYLQGRSIGLDGVIEQQKNYSRSGFKLAHRNIRFELPGMSGLTKEKHCPEILPINDDLLERVFDYDAHFFPARREQFLKHWIRQPGVASLCWLDNNQVRGYSVMRRCRKGYKVGPLYADDNDVAEQLFSTLITSAGEGPVYLDVPETNREAVKLALTHGMRQCFETARMYTWKEWNLPLDRIYGITSFEIG